MTKLPVPENILGLWKEEDQIRSWAIEKIAEHEYLPDHLKLIETYMDCVDMVRKLDLKPKRRNALASLYLRTFDNFGSALRETLSGKHRGCAMYLRDQLETYFLIDYLSSEDGRPEAWIGATPEEIRKNYKPWQIRKSIDERDNLGKSKRGDMYGMLSALGAHPSPQGLEMSRDGMRALRMGPFKQIESLQQCIEEATIQCVLLSPKLILFCYEFGEQGRKVSSSLVLQYQKVSERNFGAV